jgi:exosortase
VVRIGTMLSNPVNHYQYEVAAACSGIRSLIGLGLVATIVAFLNYRMLRWRLVLIALAVPLAVAGNVVRLLTIVLAAEFGGQEAGDFVHSGGPGGLLSLLPYLPAMFGLAFVVRQFQEPHRPEGKAV